MHLLENILAGIQYLLPHHLLSGMVHWFMRIRVNFIKNTQITLIGEMAGVDWSESKLKSASDFEHFNAFFTRELANGVRPIDADPLSFVCPSDGRISECGRITNDRILQAKGHHYSIRSLLANDPSVAGHACLCLQTTEAQKLCRSAAGRGAVRARIPLYPGFPDRINTS